ncbi:hypothetical protein SAMN04487944_115109 [Gracilibacillus ureilyticus]|uniref:Uncharacterized protein n=1 Tax=Gracilibacillus ureilyticus TaxID=531814 RepID=A0A1H9U180_9BACI|nr:hypothetical protein [Gracilibacillus ureilyticus]SES02917.1 hypothetical protein SAMN04487944_115109 [Gracilibacillus ureilyticus]
MFVIVRDVNGETETLKDSNSDLNKTFSDFSAADLLAKKLNSHLRQGPIWNVIWIE